LIGKTLAGRYRLERVLGAGGMGSVYAAEDAQTGQRVAVKLIHGNLPADAAGLVQRFEREARAAGSIDTENICRCLDAGTDPESGQPFMVLEYLVGEDLQNIIKRLGPLPRELALRVTAQACLGLSAAHQAGIVHRDIKPANIFLAKAGEAEHTVKLLDFGVAKIRRDPTDVQGDTAGLTRTGSLLGSPLYMSPEQARSVKNVDHRADIWSMGVVLYQALAGRTPYHHVAGLGDLIIALCSDLPPPVQQFAPWVEPDVAAVIDRALRVDPRERWQTAAEMLEAIRALLPNGLAIRDDMMVPLDDATHDHIAPTYFRNLHGGGTAIVRPGDLASSPAARIPSEVEGADTVAKTPSEPRPAPLAASPAAPPQATQNAVATTGPGLTATETGTPRAAKSPPIAAIAIACALAGGAGVWALTRPTPAPAAVVNAVPNVATATQTQTATAPAPTVTPSATAVPTAAETATPAPSDSASAKPAASASAPKPAASVPKKTNRLDYTSYGDRK
jgi:serine/threonine-protein kinase